MWIQQNIVVETHRGTAIPYADSAVKAFCAICVHSYNGVSPSGKARDFDSRITGSTPVTPTTSSKKNFSGGIHFGVNSICSRGEIGRRAGFRVRCPVRAGSNPVESTISLKYVGQHGIRIAVPEGAASVARL